MSEPPTSALRLELLLADALRPIEPPERFSGRLEETFTKLAESAAAELNQFNAWAEELTDSEREALRDPRNWVRPLGAAVAGSVAGGALFVLGARRRRRGAGADLGAEISQIAGEVLSRISNVR